jgi:hypothetical protein
MALHTHISPEEWIMGQLVAAVQTHSLTSYTWTTTTTIYFFNTNSVLATSPRCLSSMQCGNLQRPYYIPSPSHNLTWFSWRCHVLSHALRVLESVTFGEEYGLPGGDLWLSSAAHGAGCTSQVLVAGLPT